MEHLVNKRVQDIQISGIRKFANLVANYPDAISLTIGQPDFPTPEHVKTAGAAAIAANKTGYTHNAGLLELRQKASEFVKHKYEMNYNPVDEVIVTVGASQAIDITLRTILEEGSEVILPAPIYPGYEPIIRLCGGVPVHVDTTGHDFKMTAELIRPHLTAKTRCVIIPSPSNPTGCLLNQAELAAIAELLQDKEIFVLSDEIYSELVFAEKHVSIATFPGMRDKTIVINGLSKSHSMTGWRIGFTFAPAYLTQHMLKVHQYNVTCATSVSQYAALEALTNGVDDAVAMKVEYAKRRDYVYDRLVAMGFDVVKPEGAFYIFPSIKKFEMKSFDFAMRLLEENRVAIVPGDGFSAYGEGYVRISYAYSMEILEQGLDRLEQFVQGLSK